MTSPGIVFVDGRIDPYRGLELPSNWTKHVEYRKPDMADAMRWVFRRFPNEKNYGWFADDLRAETPGWDKKLEEAAGDWYLADCNDLWLAEGSARGGSLCGAFCWGGELVRTVGWWALPGVKQAGIDDAWVFLCVHNDRVRKYLDDVVVVHFHYKNKKRPKDATDSWIRNDKNYIENDFRIFNKWKDSIEGQETVSRLKRALHEAGVEPIIG